MSMSSRMQIHCLYTLHVCNVSRNLEFKFRYTYTASKSQHKMSTPAQVVLPNASLSACHPKMTETSESFEGVKEQDKVRILY